MTTPAENAAREIGERIFSEWAKADLGEPGISERIAAALLAAREAGRAEERAAVVKYLSAMAKLMPWRAKNTLASAAINIDQGQHATPPRDHLAKGSE